jgi:putative DNA primase/helicase
MKNNTNNINGNETNGQNYPHPGPFPNGEGVVQKGMAQVHSGHVPQEAEAQNEHPNGMVKMGAGEPIIGGTYGQAAEKLLKQVVLEPWPDPVAGAELLDELSGLVSRFVVLPKRAADALALWMVHTYAFELGEVTAYIGVESPEKRCGKSTLLTLLSRLVNRSVVASNISAAAFFRVIEQTRPTLIIDEADTFLRKADELRGIMNSGYYRSTGYVVRVANEKVQTPKSKLQGSISTQSSSTGTEANDKVQHPNSKNQRNSNYQDPSNEEVEVAESVVGGLRHYSCWCPKVLASIGRLPETLADRCIVVRMERKRPDELCERLKSLKEEQANVLRRKCARFVLDHAEEIRSREPEVPQILNDRAADIWEPLLVIADIAGGAWVERARASATSLSVTAQERSPMGSLLLDLLLMFLIHEEKKQFLTREIVAWLNGFEERPWWVLRKGKEVTDIWLAQRLRPYGIAPKNVWVDGVQGKGYEFKQCDEVLRRYIPRAEWEARKAEMREAREQREAAEKKKAEEGGGAGEGERQTLDTEG